MPIYLGYSFLWNLPWYTRTHTESTSYWWLPHQAHRFPSCPASSASWCWRCRARFRCSWGHTGREAGNSWWCVSSRGICWDWRCRRWLCWWWWVVPMGRTLNDLSVRWSRTSSIIFSSIWSCDRCRSQKACQWPYNTRYSSICTWWSKNCWPL